MLLHAEGGPQTILTDDHISQVLIDVLERQGEKKNVCLLPPDFTRFHSNAGVLTQAAYRHYGDHVKDIMPALGTHAPMTDPQLEEMFNAGELIPKTLFRVHDWRNDVVKIGEVPASMVSAASNGAVNEPWPAQLNKLVWEGNHDMIVSLGQVVPHEVMGMANHSKNLLVGVGGADAINFSHFIGACYGMENMMGRADTPLRLILNYAADHFLNKLPILYVLTVRGRNAATGQLVTRGLFIGTGIQCFNEASKLSLQVNFELLDAPLKKVVVYLDPNEYHSTWLGNKSIYRTRMAMADNGHLIILAPGVKTFGEDPSIDLLIRKFGYRTTPEVMQYVKDNLDLLKNLSAAAHLIHGTTEGRFHVQYCTGGLSKAEIESVGYDYGEIEAAMKRYDVQTLKDGWNTDTITGESFFYVSNPALGLWAFCGRFENAKKEEGGGSSGGGGGSSGGSSVGGGGSSEQPNAKRQKVEKD